MAELDARESRLFADYEVPVLAGPEYPADSVPGPAGKAARPQRAAAAPTGAMVALVPTEADAARLAVDGGEPAGELHTTLAYLGKAADIPDDVRAQIVDAIRSAVGEVFRPEYDLPVDADAFAVSVFNPAGDEPCIVLVLSGKELASIRADVIDTLREVAGLDLPKQHDTFVPHITLLYTGDATQVAELTDRTGPVTFDRIRIAFAGEVVDIPLADAPAPVALPAEPRIGVDNTADDATAETGLGELLPIRFFTEPADPYDPLDDEGDDVGARTEARAERTRMRVEAKKKWFSIRNTSAGTDIYLYGEIGCWGVTASDFTEELRAVKSPTIELHINSPGGDVFDGVAIYEALDSHPATVNVSIDGLAASAASFIAMVGKRIKIAEFGQMMIHEASSGMYGTGRRLRKHADTLDKTTEIIARVYAKRAGGDPSVWLALMEEETWFDSAEAVQFGLADEISGSTAEKADAGAAVPTKAVWDLSVFNFAGREHAPAPALVSMTASTVETPAEDGSNEPVSVAQSAVDPVETAASEPEAEPVAETPAAEPVEVTDVVDVAAIEQPAKPPAPTPAPEAAPTQQATWSAPAWATEPADPWQQLVAGLTNPAPIGVTATAQEATK